MKRLTMHARISRTAGLLCIVLSAVAHAGEKVALAGGGTIALDKKGLHLSDASNQSLASIPVRAKQVDVRSAAGRGLAVVLDADTQHVLPVRIDLPRGALTRLAPLPVMSFGVESMCLFRDQQGLDHLFIAGKDGQAEQWLMLDDGERLQPRLVRKLSMPLDTKQCRVDDASHTLYVEEPGIGMWAYEASSEAMPGRSLLREGAGAKQKPGRAANAAKVAPRAKGANAVNAAHAAHAVNAANGVNADNAANAAKAPNAAKVPYAATNDAAAGMAVTAATTAGQMSAAVVIQPRVQTEPVARFGDVADDPAIWVHPADAARSRVLGTNKKQGLMVYDMQGKQQQFLASGRLNNVDLRQGVVFDGKRFDLAVASQRDDNSVVLYGIDGEGQVGELARIATGFEDVYGICLFQPRSGGLEVVVNDKGGLFRQFRIERRGDMWSGKLAREFRVGSQPEGCVADDRNDRLFIGEEKRGVWTLSARADQPAAMKLVLGVGRDLRADVEGMAVYHGQDAAYLIVSSQGDSSYVVLDAAAPYRLRGRFKVGFNVEAGIDGTADTDGLDVTSHNLGGVFAQGMLVIQDGYKRMPDGPQNFKYVSWADVAKALHL